MTDHHDFGFDHDDHHDSGGFDDPLHDPLHDAGHDEPLPYEDHDAYPAGDHADPFAVHDPGPPDHDSPELLAHPGVTDQPETAAPDEHVTELYDTSESVFPPAVDVGELPEPVDGFPWIDTGSLGLADIAAAVHDAGTTEPVRPEDLAEYAATDLPPGEDPWAALADSDDPATAALAKWWTQN